MGRLGWSCATFQPCTSPRVVGKNNCLITFVKASSGLFRWRQLGLWVVAPKVPRNGKMEQLVTSEQEYIDLLQKILDRGTKRGDRTGEGLLFRMCFVEVLLLFG